MNTNCKFMGSLCLLAALSAALPAKAANVVVGTCMPNKVSYGSLSEAVQGVPTGSTIQVCPGVYAEQVTIVGKSLTLKGITSGNAANPVLMWPAGGPAGNAIGLAVTSFFGAPTALAAQMLISAGASVTITGLAFDGSGQNTSSCAPVAVGVLVQDASATLNQVAVKNELNPCGTNGVGVGVLSQNDSGTATTITVKNSTLVNDAQTFESDGANNTATLTNNSLLGNPATNANAISILYGNSTIQNNSIANFSWPLATTDINTDAYGIFFECTPGGTANNNVVTNTQVGIYALNTCTTTNVSITNNTVSNSSDIAIDAGGTNGLVQGNDIRSTPTAIRFPLGASNTVQNNMINDACTAYGYNPLAGANSLLGDTIVNVQNLSITNTTGLCP